MLMNIFKFLTLTAIFTSFPALSKVYTFECEYPTYSDETGLKEATGFNFKFVSDTDTGKTYMNGNNGSTEVFLSKRADDEGFNIVEMTNAGNMMITTILLNGSSVHSRNSVILGEIIASQYYGRCDIK